MKQAVENSICIGSSCVLMFGAAITGIPGDTSKVIKAFAVLQLCAALLGSMLIYFIMTKSKVARYLALPYLVLLFAGTAGWILSFWIS